MPELTERFWAKVDKSDDCWLWTAGKSANGYGKFKAGPKQVSAHRYAYEQCIGPIPSGLQIDHLCRVRHCVNPVHLEPVTCRENIHRGISFSAQNAVKTHCPRGHEYTEDNIYRGTKGDRRCKTCLNKYHVPKYRRNKK